MACRAKAGVRRKYPGFGTTPMDLRQTERQINKLLEAAEDPVLSQTEAGQGLTLYLTTGSRRSGGRGARPGDVPAGEGRTRICGSTCATLPRRSASATRRSAELFETTFSREMVSDDD